jgi:hypothetical protein
MVAINSCYKWLLNPQPARYSVWTHTIDYHRKCANRESSGCHLMQTVNCIISHSDKIRILFKSDGHFVIHRRCNEEFVNNGLDSIQTMQFTLNGYVGIPTCLQCGFGYGSHTLVDGCNTTGACVYKHNYTASIYDTLALCPISLWLIKWNNVWK